MLSSQDQRSQYLSCTSNEIGFDSSHNIPEEESQEQSDLSATDTCASTLIRKINPPPGIKFGVHLQHILSSHHGVDLKVYNEIINSIQYHVAVHKTDFGTTKLYNRNELTSKLSNLYNLNQLKPKMYRVTLSDSTHFST